MLVFSFLLTLQVKDGVKSAPFTLVEKENRNKKEHNDAKYHGCCRW